MRCWSIAHVNSFSSRKTRPPTLGGWLAGRAAGPSCLMLAKNAVLRLNGTNGCLLFGSMSGLLYVYCRLRTGLLVEWWHGRSRYFFFYFLPFARFTNETTMYIPFKNGLRPTESCQMSKLTVGRRNRTRDLQVELSRLWPLDHYHLFRFSHWPSYSGG